MGPTLCVGGRPSSAREDGSPLAHAVLSQDIGNPRRVRRKNCGGLKGADVVETAHGCAQPSLPDPTPAMPSKAEVEGRHGGPTLGVAASQPSN